MGHHRKHHKKRHPFKMLLILIVSLIILLLVAGLSVGIFQTYQIEHRSQQKQFTAGKVPEPLPDGQYRGNEQTGISKSWQGKSFDQAKQTGVNRFTDGERYTFNTYSASGLRDKNTQVLRIDYNQSGNPWWLKFVVDEIVEVKPDHYLGKVHVKLIPGLPFTLTYFELTK